jgi:hypothetical protein
MVLSGRALIHDRWRVECLLVLVIVRIIHCYLLRSPEYRLLDYRLGWWLIPKFLILQSLVVLLLSSHERRHVSDQIKLNVLKGLV